VDTGNPVVESASHLLNIVQQVLGSQDNVQITLPGIGSVTVLSQNREYHADINDMREFSIAPAANFEIKTLDIPELASVSKMGKDVRDLLWQIAFHIYEDRLIESCSENDVIQFSRWPNLTRLPTTPNTARICALLTRHPTSITLIRRVLGIDRKEVNRVISAAISAGIVNTITRGPSLVSAEPAATEIRPEQTQKSGLWNSLFAKISSL
jgi:predicted transcriptional regulator